MRPDVLNPLKAILFSHVSLLFKLPSNNLCLALLDCNMINVTYAHVSLIAFHPDLVLWKEDGYLKC